MLNLPVAFTVRKNWPSTSVTVPFLVPSTITDAPGNGLPDSESITLPEILTGFSWQKRFTDMPNNKVMGRRIRRINFFKWGQLSRGETILQLLRGSYCRINKSSRECYVMVMRRSRFDISRKYLNSRNCPSPFLPISRDHCILSPYTLKHFRVAKN